MSDVSPAPVRVILSLCAAELLTMLGVFAFPALLPDFIAQWSLSSTEAGWVSGITFAGYAVSVPVLMTLTDRIDAKRVYVAGALLTALSAAGFALTATGLWTALGWRALGGVGLAGTYMPGLKVLVDRVQGRITPARQARWISFYTASFSLGTSLSFLINGAVAQVLDWHAAFELAAATALAAALIAVTLSSSRPAPGAANASHPFDFRPVFRNRAAMGYILGYAGHVWELFGVRSWMVAFLAFALSLQPGAWGPSPTAAATLASLLAVAASIGGADLAVRFDRIRVCSAAMLASAALSLVIGFTAALPYGLVVALVLLHNVLVQLDSAALTTGAVLVADPARRGATIAIHSLMGFGGGFLGPLAFGMVLDLGGGSSSVAAWGLAFASLALVVAPGPLALRWARK
jgi:MFS family permease